MELFAADGHDAGGCERVTGKSGMRPVGSLRQRQGQTAVFPVRLDGGRGRQSRRWELRSYTGLREAVTIPQLFGVGAALIGAVGVGYAIGRGGCPQCSTAAEPPPAQYFAGRNSVQCGRGTELYMTEPDGLRTCVPTENRGE